MKICIFFHLQHNAFWLIFTASGYSSFFSPLVPKAHFLVHIASFRRLNLFECTNVLSICSNTLKLLHSKVRMSLWNSKPNSNWFYVARLGKMMLTENPFNHNESELLRLKMCVWCSKLVGTYNKISAAVIKAACHASDFYLQTFGNVFSSHLCTSFIYKLINV